MSFLKGSPKLLLFAILIFYNFSLICDTNELKLRIDNKTLQLKRTEEVYKRKKRNETSALS